MLPKGSASLRRAVSCVEKIALQKLRCRVTLRSYAFIIDSERIRGAGASGDEALKFTQYFLDIRGRSDRAGIRDEWIQRVVEHPVKEHIQADGRIRRWAAIEEMDGKYLRVILLPDGETVHNAFFDRGFIL